jgi:TldD protein
VVGCARSGDGEVMCDHVMRVVSRPDQLPEMDALAAEVDALAVRLEVWRAAPREADEWVGPVIFEGDAAVEVVQRLLVPAVVGTAPRETATDDFSRVSVADGGLGLNRRVLPPGWSVVDDPGADPALPSSYTFDDEGVPGQRLSLVEDGLVRDLLMSRVPGDDLQQSNGHARGSVGTLLRGTPSNLSVTPDRARSDKKLFDQAFALARTYGLDHVMVVRRVADTDVGSSQFRAAFRSSTSERTDLPAPVEIVRRYADGREVVVRGLAFHAVDRRTLRDVVGAGRSTTRTVLYGGSGPTGGTPITLTVPSLLVSEIELVPMEGAASRPPRVTSPLAER